MPSEVERVRDELAAAWGPELGRVRRLVAVLADGDWHAVGELVAVEFAGLDPADPLARLLGSTWRLRVHARGGRSTPAVLVAERIQPPARDALGFVLRYLVDHRQAVLGNAWREALIAWAAAADGRRVTKNQARQAIAAGPLAAQLQSHLAELPLELLRLLVADVGRTLEALPARGGGRLA